MLIRVLLPALFALLLSSLATAEEEGAGPQVQYIELQPPFVLNFGSLEPKLRYLKAQVSVRVDKADAAATVEQHMPAIRNELVLLLSRQTDATMFDPTAREGLREEALKNVQALLKEEAGNASVRDLLFTEFIVQR